MKLKEQRLFLEKHLARYSPDSNCLDAIVFDNKDEIVHFNNSILVRTVMVDTIEDLIENDVLFYHSIFDDRIEGEAIAYDREFEI